MAPEPTILDVLRDGRAAARNMRRMAEQDVLTQSLANYYLKRIDAAFDRMMGEADAPRPEPFTVIEGGRS
jgi:hypothetical protein